MKWRAGLEVADNHKGCLEEVSVRNGEGKSSCYSGECNLLWLMPLQALPSGSNVVRGSG